MSDTSAIADRIETALRAAFAVDRIMIIDESAQHIGHAGAASGRHFRLQIVSPAFNGLSRIGRHRLVYDALASLLQHEIHALAIVAHATDEV